MLKNHNTHAYNNLIITYIKVKIVAQLDSTKESKEKVFISKEYYGERICSPTRRVSMEVKFSPPQQAQRKAKYLSLL